MENKKRELTLIIGRYKVVKKSETKVYVLLAENDKFITHREKWKQATKLAKMLNEAYNQGFADGIY